MKSKTLHNRKKTQSISYWLDNKKQATAMTSKSTLGGTQTRITHNKLLVFLKVYLTRILVDFFCNNNDSLSYWARQAQYTTGFGAPNVVTVHPLVQSAAESRSDRRCRPQLLLAKLKKYFIILLHLAYYIMFVVPNLRKHHQNS